MSSKQKFRLIVLHSEEDFLSHSPEAVVFMAALKKIISSHLNVDLD